MSKISLSVDIGSKNIVIANKESQVILNEPCVLASAIVDNKHENVACGAEAIKYATEHDKVQLICPIQHGSVDNQVSFVYMMKTFIERLSPKKFFKNYVSVIVNVSCGLTNIEKRTIEDSFYKAGAKEVVIVESPLSVKAINNDRGMFLINIGASDTEIAMVSDDGIVNGCSIDVGGNNIDNLIHDYMLEKYKIIIDSFVSEDIKLSLATLDDNDLSTLTVIGHDMLQDYTKEVKITARELRPLLQSVIDKIIEVVASVLLMIPKTYLNVIDQNGIYLVGGTSKLHGITDYMKERLFLDVKVIDEPELVVAKGGSKFFYDKGKLARMLSLDNMN